MASKSRESHARASKVADPPANREAIDALLREAERHDGAIGWRVLLFQLSKLQRVHRRSKHLHIAANMLQDLVKKHDGKLFPLPNGDLAVVCKGIRTPIVEDAISTLRYLFNDDPFAGRAVRESGFCSSFDLQHEYLRLATTLRRRAGAPWETAASAGSTLDPTRVAQLLTAVSRVDLAPILRRQTAWRMVDGRHPQPHSEELFISITALNDAIGSAFDVTADRQLFGYLTRWLDSYMLKTLSWEHFGAGPPVSVNINLETLRAPEFAAFEERRLPAWRGRIMLEMQLGDIWSDFPAFLEMSKRLKAEGYLRCIDGVVFSALRFLNLRQLEVDYVKLIWNDDLANLGDAALRELCQSVAECGADRIILTRCDRQKALQIGRLLGIQIFQGWIVNTLPPRA
jgi:EAL domain-containing protein (putative c-di-GMP-specific phosphodiesterase class I)